MMEPDSLLRCLARESVEFILVGGVAAALHGSARLTQDVDIVYRRSPDNIGRLAAALRPHHPWLRGAPRSLPFMWDAVSIERGLNFTLSTDLGDIDLLGEIVGGGRYEDLLTETVAVTLFGLDFKCLGLRRLIEIKRAAGRPKDLEAIAELEAILEEREKM